MSKQSRSASFSYKEWLPSFARRIGKKIPAKQQALLQTLLPRIEVSLPKQGNITPSSLFNAEIDAVRFEIGFGSGEHILHQAKLNPQIGFIGCEPYVNGIAKVLLTIEEEGIENIRIWKEDARTLINQLADQSIAQFYILFPDPWPKLRHHKRRIITHTLLALLNKKLIPKGKLLIATDHLDYAEWIEALLLKQPYFTLQNDTHIAPEDWVETRYQQKAHKEGRTGRFFHLQRA